VELNDDLGEVRLFLEGVACDLLFFEHLAEGLPPESIRIRQEVYLGPHAFADIETTAGSADPYFVEIDVGYSRERILESIRRKYSTATRATNASRVIVVVDSAIVQTDRGLESAIREHLRPSLQLELWNERQLLDRFARRFGVTTNALTEAYLLDIRQAIDHAKGVYAFGDDFRYTPLEEGLLWQLAFWRCAGSVKAGAPIRERFSRQGTTPRLSWSSPTSAPTRATCATPATRASCANR
jgi:hypothetical protein